VLPSCRYDSERRGSFSQRFARNNLVEKITNMIFYGTPFRSQQFLILFICSLSTYLLTASPFLHISSFLIYQSISFYPFYFHNSIIYILHNLIISKHFYLFTNRNNLKTEIRLTTLHGIPFFKHLNYCYEISGFKHLNISRFRNTRLICQVIWFIRTATLDR